MTERRARRKPGENRALLLEAGLIEFGLFGYHGASTASIASRAGVPQPHLYASFRGKQELFLACLERVCAELPAADEVSLSTGARLDDLDSNARSFSPAHSMFVFQAYAAAGDATLRAPLRASLRHLERLVGPRGVVTLLDTAARALSTD